MRRISSRAYQAHPEKISFYFTTPERKLLAKVANRYLPLRKDQRLAFLYLGRWVLAHLDQLEVHFARDANYCAQEALPLDDLLTRKIAQQAKDLRR